MYGIVSKKPLIRRISYSACLPLSGSSLSSNCRISGVREMCSLSLLPLELDVDDDEPILSMHELMTSLSFPPETLPFSPNGENLLCSGVVLVRFTTVGPLRVLCGTVGGSGVSNRRCVVGVVCMPIDVKGSFYTGARWSST